MSKKRWDERYELLETIAQGGILTICRARDTERDRLVVLRLIRPHLCDDAGLVERFRREAERLVHLRHPNLIPVQDVVIGEEVAYLVADIPVGKTLERQLAGHGPLEIDDALSIVSQVAEALDCAQAQAVFHHDLRPSNIYLDGKTAQLADFYVLEAVGATPVYMAPEQLDETSAEIADQRSDAYALGIIVYEMLTGRPPFQGTAADVAAAHLTQRPTPPRVHNPDLLPALDAILLKALAKQPQSRYQIAGELAAALHEAVRVAQTRRMADEGVFDDQVGMIYESAYSSPQLSDEKGIPTWVWVGSAVLLAVVIAITILLVTG